ncbi:MAG: methyltransferase domain-containing protein [Chlamydiales bacterium]|nr:methyltransferase domain-containing protein [Chlamydiales bacterium]
MRSIGEALYLPLLKALVAFRAWKEERQVQARYYKNPVFKQIDQRLKQIYSSRDPFQISREFLQRRGDPEIYAYGETPLTVLEEIGRECGLSETDTFLDLGCGTGRGLFFLAEEFGCKVVGIDWISEFTNNANKIAGKRAFFATQNILDADLSQATVIYLYGTCLEDETILALIQRFKQLPLSCKILTVSYPLSDYDPSFSIQKIFTSQFPWGTTEIYLNIYQSKF